MSEEAKCPVAHGLDPNKQDLSTLPSRMRLLPVDERGFVVPWFVDKDDQGKWEFRAMDARKWERAVKEKRCWVCGDRLGRYQTFVAGPMCGVNRTSSEPPCHLECARWSAINCPFLNNPEMIRRTDDEINQLSKSIGGNAITRNPGVSMLWTALDYSVWRDGRGWYLITMGEPQSIEWYSRGRKATRSEVMASIESGLPNLRNVAATEKGGLEHLTACIEKFLPLVPAE